MRHLCQTLSKAAIVLLLVFAPSLAFAAASLSISPVSDSYSSGKSFSVRVRVSTDQSINAVSGNLNFPTDKLQVTSVSKVGSILSLWVEDPSFDNNAGTVSFQGVVPNPGYTGTDGLVLSVTFKAVGAGNAKVNFADASVLANDGSGSNILNSVTPATYSLGGVAAPTQVVTPAQSPGTPNAPTITSSTHPSQSTWYTQDSAKFSWTIDPDTIATRVLLGKIPDSIPTVEYDPPITEKEIDNIEDGVWYFHVQNKNKNGWGAVAHYTLRIDTSAPEAFTMKEVPRSDPTDPNVRLSLSASDNFSGIKSFGIQIDKGDMADWVDDGTGIYETKPLSPGDHTIFARAYDQAGNFATASLNVNVAAIESPIITSYTNKVSTDSPMIVRGTALPSTTVRTILTKGDAVHSEDTNVGTDGSFYIAMNTKDLEGGAYELTAITIDGRGAQSNPTSPKSVLINSGWLRVLGSTILTVLAFAIPALALLFVLYIIFMRGYYKVKRSKRDFKNDLNEIEHLVDQAFMLLKEDVEDSIRLLERTKSRRRLTDEEDAIIERLRQNLRDAEKVIHGKMRKIERDME